MDRSHHRIGLLRLVHLPYYPHDFHVHRRHLQNICRIRSSRNQSRKKCNRRLFPPVWTPAFRQLGLSLGLVAARVSCFGVDTYPLGAVEERKNTEEEKSVGARTYG